MIELTTEVQFNQTANSPLALIDIYTTWCPPCRIQEKILKKLEDEFQNQVVFARLNAEKLPKLCDRLKIMYVPTLLLYREGKLVKRFTGLQKEKKLKKTLTTLLMQP